MAAKKAEDLRNKLKKLLKEEDNLKVKKGVSH